mgnify:CR=1 FL=1
MAETPEYFDNVTVGQYAMTGVPLKVYVSGEYLIITDPDDVENPLIGYGMLPNGEMEPFDYKQVEHLLVSGNVVDLETYKKAMEDDDKEKEKGEQEETEEEDSEKDDEEADKDAEEGGDEEEEGGDEEKEDDEGTNPFESVMPSLASLVEITKDVKKAREKALDAEEDALKDKRKALDDEPITDGVINNAVNEKKAPFPYNLGYTDRYNHFKYAKEIGMAVKDIEGIRDYHKQAARGGQTAVRDLSSRIIITTYGQPDIKGDIVRALKGVDDNIDLKTIQNNYNASDSSRSKHEQDNDMWKWEIQKKEDFHSWERKYGGKPKQDKEFTRDHQMDFIDMLAPYSTTQDQLADIDITSLEDFLQYAADHVSPVNLKKVIKRIKKEYPKLESVNEARGRAGEELSMISKSRAKASLRQIKKGKRDDGMGKFDAKLYGVDVSGDEHEITDEDEINIYKKFGLRSIDEGQLNEAVGIGTLAAMLLAAGLMGRLALMNDKQLQGLIDTASDTGRGLKNMFKKGFGQLARQLPIIGKKLRYKDLQKLQTQEVAKYLKDEISDRDIINILSKDPKIKALLDDVANGSRSYSDLYHYIKEVGGGKGWGGHYIHDKFKKLRKDLMAGNIAESVNEAKVDLDDAFYEFDNSDYEPSYRSHSDLSNFIEFLRAEYPRGTIFETINESVIGDILIIADENNTYEAFTAELVNQKYLMPDELEDPETKEWLETTYAQVHESVSLKSLANEARKPRGYYEKKFKHLKKKPKYKKGDLVVYVQDLGGPDELSPETSRVKKVSKGLAGFKYDLTNYIQTNDSEILGLAESVNEARDFKKGDKVSYKNDDGKTKSGYIIKKMTRTFRGKKSIQYLIGKTKTTDPKLGRFDTVSTAAGKTPKNMFFREDHMSGAPYEYDNISEPYSIKVGDMVKNTNPSCPHNGSQGMVKKVIPMPNDIGQLIKYVVMNQGDTYQAGDVLTKTPDQLEVM